MSHVSDKDLAQWLAQMRAVVEASGQTWVKPHVCETEDETCLEWWHRKRKLTVYLCSPAYGEYIKVWGPNMDTEMEDGEVNEHNMASLWFWLNEVAS